MSVFWFVLGVALGAFGIPLVEYHDAPKEYMACQQMLNDAFERKREPLKVGDASCPVEDTPPQEQALVPPTPRMPSAP